MSESSQDSDRAEGRAHWRARGEAWNRTSPAGTSGGERYNRALIDGTGIAAGQCVLDLGSGTGQPAIALSEIVGPAGCVVALDHVAEMLSGTRRRADAAGAHNIALVVADMVELPFRAGSLDAVTARFSLMSVPDKGAALREARRVLRPGGRAAFVVWGPEERNDRFRAVRMGALAVFGADVAGRPGARHALGGDGTMARLMADAGFTAVEERDIVAVDVQPAEPPPWRSSVERNYARRLDALGPGARDGLDRAMRDAFAPFLDNGAYRLNVHAKLGIGTA